MRIVLLRVGIDSGSGGIQGPLFEDGSFEFLPIPDEFRNRGVDSRTYGSEVGRSGRKLIEYFPERLRAARSNSRLHLDPEFETFTYGDPTSPKRSLRTLTKADLLVFYAGLEGWDFSRPPALYIVGYFKVAMAGLATEFSKKEIAAHFARNFHVRHECVYENQKDRLVLVKGGPESRLLSRACLISCMGRNRAGQPLKVLSPEACQVFGHFDGHTSIQRSTPRWVWPQYVSRAADFVTSLD